MGVLVDLDDFNLDPQAVARAASLPDDQLLGSLRAARRLANQVDYLQTVLIAEFAHRRQAQSEAAQAMGKPAGRRDGEFPGEELAIELTETLAYAGTRIDTADVIASKAYIDAIALRLRDSGLFGGSLDRLRALALTDLTQGRDPLDRLNATPSPSPGPSTTDTPGDERRPGRPGRPASFPALINLLVPAATLLGLGTAPGQAAGWGLLDSAETRSLVATAAGHPRTRWCVTVTAPDGTAVAHGCASGRHPWLESSLPPGPAPPARSLGDLLRRLNVTLRPVARDSCDHSQEEARYVPSRRLRHLVRARSQTCTAPACNAQAVFCDLDHSLPYPGGPTDQCNLNPRCRRKHKAKQSPDWKVEQEAGVICWTLPSGRTHITEPASYLLTP